MQLERLGLALRRRTPWEALDLSLIMLRAWRGPVYRAWFATFVPVAALLMLVLHAWPTLAMLLVWWLKPLFDRFLLKVFAEASFAAPPTVGEVWRALPGLLRHSGLIAGLTWRRFNTQRAFDLPVWQLEGQRGKAGRSRLRVLGRKVGSHAFWLTFVCIHFVVIFEFSFVALIDILRPSGAPPLFDWSEFWRGEERGWQTLAFNVAWLAAETIVEPYYVAAGFSLYLNRRSDLEGWDIEVAFRRLAARRPDETPPTPRRGAMIALLVACLAGLAVAPGDARATDAGPPGQCRDDAAAAVETAAATAASKRPSGEIRRAAAAVLADPVFGRTVEDWNWQYREEKKKAAARPWWVDVLARLAKFLAIGLRTLVYVLVVLVAAALLVVLYRYRHRVFADRARSAHDRTDDPATLFGVDLRPAALPDDIAGAALAEVDAGRYAAALSLLYRGTLVALIRRGDIEFRVGDTEDICRQRASGRIDTAAADYFARLLAAWKRTAYAEQPPAAATARELCRGWSQHFAPSQAADTPGRRSAGAGMKPA